MMALTIIIAQYSQVTLVTAGHTWSQLVTLVTVKSSDLNNDGLDVYYGPYGIILGTCDELYVSTSSKQA